MKGMKTRYGILLLIAVGIGLILILNYLEFINELNDFRLILIVVVAMIMSGIIGGVK
jgi:uncharacterized membrane protein YoaT (DUF817 family)